MSNITADCNKEMTRVVHKNPAVYPFSSPTLAAHSIILATASHRSSSVTFTHSLATS